MEMVLRATAVYWFLWLFVRGSGKRSLAELSALDLLVVVVIGDIVQQGVTQEDMSITGASIAAATFVLWTITLDQLGRRHTKAAAMLRGSPVVLVRHGEILNSTLRHERMSVDELREAAREEGLASLDEVEICVLETDGTLSFIRREDVPR